MSQCSTDLGDLGSLRARDAGQLGPNGALVATPNQTMAYIGVGRAKLYELLNGNELESYVEGSSRKILWPSIHDYVKRRLAAEAERRGRAQERTANKAA